MCACHCNRCCRCCCCGCNCGNGDSGSTLPSLPGQGSGSSYPVWISIPAFLSARDTDWDTELASARGLSCLRCAL